MIKLALTLGLSALLLAACGDDDPTSAPVGKEPAVTSFSGTLLQASGGKPMPDLEVTLFEPSAQTAVARDVSDADGRFEFLDVPAGSYIPVVHANGYRPVLMAEPRWTLEEGQQIDIVLRMRITNAIRMTDKTLSGVVVDRETGERIPNARIEMNFFGGGELAQVNWSEYAGWSTTLEATSNENGEFFIYPLPTIENGFTGLIYIPGYRATAPGYQSRRMKRNYEPESVNSMLAGVRLSPGEDLGSIEGVVTDPNGLPVEGVPVSTEWRRVDELLRGLEPVDDPRDPDEIMIPDGVAYTDAEGYYRITGLPQGFFNVEAGIYPDDGWVGVDAVQGVEIPGFNSTVTADLQVTPAIGIVYPPNGAILSEPPDHLEWEPHPGAVKYDIELQRDVAAGRTRVGSLGTRLDTEPVQAFLYRNASYSWRVLARDEKGVGIGLSDRPHVFHVQRDPD